MTETIEDKEFAGPDQFAAAAKRRYRDHDVPGFGRIRLQSLSELEIGEWETEDMGEDWRRTADGMKLMKSGLICRCLVDAAGRRRLHDAQRQLVAAADSAVVNAIFELCREHCGIPRRDIDAMDALRAIQKNCEPDPA